MSARTRIAAAILLALAASVHAQAKPDFSGEWVLNRDACTLSPGAAAVQSGRVNIEHRDPAFRYRATLVSPTGPVQYEFELQSDGQEVASVLRGMKTESSLRWDGPALALTSNIARPAGDMSSGCAGASGFRTTTNEFWCSSTAAGASWVRKT